jgi:outer membrane receptor protein involved in Fe transport
MKDRLTVSNSMYVVRSAQNSSGDLLVQAFRAPPTVPVYDASGNHSELDIYPFSPTDLENPIAMIDGRTHLDSETRIFNNFGATFTILEGLSLRSSIGIDYESSLGNDYIARYIKVGAPGGRADKNSWESYSLLNENLINYNKEFGNFRIDAVAGYTWQTYRSVGFSTGSANFVSDDLLYNALGGGSEITIPSSGGLEWGISSWLGRVNVNLKDKYLITVSGRADGSSRFAEDNKWAFFPSVGLAWRLSEEDWFEFNNLSYMKLRLSAGQSGNQAVSPYQTLVVMSDVSLAFGDALNIGYAPANIANKKLKWETTTQYDVGLDVGLFQGRLRLSMDYYYKLTTDLLAQVDLPPSAGFSSSTQNIGSVSNQGFEILIDATPVSGSFKWDISANFYVNRNKIVELSKGADVFAPSLGLLSTMHILREGEPLSMFYGFLSDGIDAEGRNAYKDLNEDRDRQSASQI